MSTNDKKTPKPVSEIFADAFPTFDFSPPSEIDKDIPDIFGSCDEPKRTKDVFPSGAGEILSQAEVEQLLTMMTQDIKPSPALKELLNTLAIRLGTMRSSEEFLCTVIDNLRDTILSHRALIKEMDIDSQKAFEQKVAKIRDAVIYVSMRVSAAMNGFTASIDNHGD